MPEIIEQLEHILNAPRRSKYVLRLYITGNTRLSSRAVANIKNICDARLKGRYELDVVDLYQHPDQAGGKQIIVAPTLIKQLPLPVRRLIGDLSNTSHVLLALDLKPNHEKGDNHEKS